MIRTVLIILATIWSLVAWGAYLLLGRIGGFAARHADAFTGHPETVVWLSWLAGILTGIGSAGLIAAWLVGLAALLLLGFAARAVVRRPRPGRAR